MIINFDDNPKKSILFLGSEILKQIKYSKMVSIDELVDSFLKNDYNYNLIYITIDYLYFVGAIKGINELGEVVI